MKLTRQEVVTFQLTLSSDELIYLDRLTARDAHVKSTTAAEDQEFRELLHIRIGQELRGS